jgi:hypothetical protein
MKKNILQPEITKTLAYIFYSTFMVSHLKFKFLDSSEKCKYRGRNTEEFNFNNGILESYLILYTILFQLVGAVFLQQQSL